MTLAGLFPGQGSQAVGMLADVAVAHASVSETFAEASEKLGYDLWALIQEGPAEKLNLTENTQPAMFVSSVALWRLWQQHGGAMPSVVAGHSLGEYSALVAAGVFDFAEAVSLVATRGQLMANACPDGQGGMAAVLGLADDKVVEICAEHEGDLVLQAVNFNGPGQVVISGHRSALEAVVAPLKDAGAKRALMLPVSVPNHSRLMTPAVAPLADAIGAMTASDAQMPVVQNLEARAYDNTTSIIDALKKHVAAPVYWTDSMRDILARDVDTVVEFGPGKVLAGLAKRMDKSLQVHAVTDLASFEKALAACQA